jgi:hypothetical protein
MYAMTFGTQNSVSGNNVLRISGPEGERERGSNRRIEIITK